MLILLPPSEGKTAPARGPKLAPGSLGYLGLKAARQSVFDAVIALCEGEPAKAAKVLGIGPQQRDLIVANAALRSAPAAPAIEVYTGVLFEALDFASLPAAVRKRADSRVAIASALFGLLRPSDKIPAYRLSGDTTLPGLGTLASVWKEAVQSELSSTRGPILDLRSSAYVKLGPVPDGAAQRAFVGRVLLERDDKRSVVSHFNKATKGRLTRAVLQQSTVPKSIDDVPGFLTDLGFRSEVREPTKGGDPRGLDIIVYQT